MSGAGSTSSDTDFVDLSKLKIPTPQGWSNERADLNIAEYFAPGRLLSEALEELGYKNVRPILTDRRDSYFIQAEIAAGKTIFLWYAISGRVLAVTEDWDLKEIMKMAGISPLNIRMSLVTET